MTPLSSRPTSNAAKDVSRPGLSAWGASQSRGSHRELSPISTTFNQSRSSTASQDFNLRSPLSPVGSVTSLNSAAAPGSRHSARSPSITSPPPGITPPPAAARSRNIASFSNNHQTSAVAAASGLGGTGSSSGGGPSRTFRASPSLSQSSYNPPTPTSATASSSSGQSGSVNRIVTSQIFILLSTIKDIDKDKAKWDTEARKIREVRATIDRMKALMPQILTLKSAGRVQRHGSLRKIPPTTHRQQCRHHMEHIPKRAFGQLPNACIGDQKDHERLFTGYSDR